MKKLLAVALCSTALIGAPAVFAQSAGGSGGGDGSTTDGKPGAGTTTSPQAPLTPSQTQTSDGAVTNPPPLDRSGNAEHVSEKKDGSNTGHGGTGGQAPGTGTDGGTGGQGGGASGGGAGDSGASGSGGQAGN